MHYGDDAEPLYQKITLKVLRHIPGSLGRAGVAENNMSEGPLNKGEFIIPVRGK
jgi:hypothetical protein